MGHLFVMTVGLGLMNASAARTDPGAPEVSVEGGAGEEESLVVGGGGGEEP